MIKQISISEKENMKKYLQKFTIFDINMYELFLENIIKNKLVTMYETSANFYITLEKNQYDIWIPRKVIFPSTKYVLLERVSKKIKRDPLSISANRLKFSNLHTQLLEVCN